LLNPPIESLIAEFRELQEAISSHPPESEMRRLSQRLSGVISRIVVHPDAAEAAQYLDLTWTTIKLDIPPGHFLEWKPKDR
jgi:hypothetical protein